MSNRLEIGKVPVEILNRIILNPINNNLNKRDFEFIMENMNIQAFR